jgi:hypothetical protein
MNYAFRSSARRITFCLVLGLVGSRFVFGMLSESSLPQTLPQFIEMSVLFVALFFLAERIYARLFSERNPKDQMEFIEKPENEN